MPRNASGVYSLPAGNPVVTNTPVATAWGNGTMSDLASEISNSLDRDGRGRMRVPMLVLDGAAAAPTYGFVNEASTGFYRAGAGQIGMSILGVLAAMFTATGITFAGTATFSGSIAVTGDVTVGDDLVVTDAVTIGGNTTVGGTLGVTGATSLPADTTIGTVSAAEIAFLTNVTSDIQTQINNRVVASVGQTWGGVQDFTGATVNVLTQAAADASTLAASTQFVKNTAMNAALPLQSAATTGKVVKSDGTNASWGSAGITREARAANTILGESDAGKLIDITGGTFSQTFTAAATLAAGWTIYIRNSGTGYITLEPNGAELIDGLTNFVMYPGETRLVICTGTAFYSIVLSAFKLEPAATMTFIEPPGYRAYEVCMVAPGGGGGSGRRGASTTVRGGGAGGGSGIVMWASVRPITAGGSITLTVGANGSGGAAVTTNDTNGAAGTTGGSHNFGGFIIAAGGGGGGGGIVGVNVGGVAATSTNGMIIFSGTAGGVQDAVGVAGSNWGATGGGGGNAINGADVPVASGPGAGGAAGIGATALAGGLAGVIAGARPGGNGNAPTTAFRGGTGGGGGAAHATLAGAVGGIGVYGGGGGGGSASLNGALSGAGGNATTGVYYVGGII